MKKTVRIFVASVGFFALAACASGNESFFKGNEYVERGSVAAETSDGTFNVSYLKSQSSGRRVIILHGTPGQAADYYRTIRNAPADMEYVVVDRPGYGETTPYKLLASLEAQADAIAPLLIEKNGQKPIVVGHSSGGPIAAMVAIRHGNKIGGLMLAAASMDPELEPDPVFVQKLGNAPVVSWFVPKDLLILNRELLSLPKQLEEMKSKLSTITAPTIIMHGTADLLVPYGNVSYMENYISNASYRETVKIEGMGHEIPWAREITFAKGIRKLADEDYTIPTSEIRIDRRDWAFTAETRREVRDPANRSEK
ncbi:alpha/beta hydrolase [Kordiimonas sp. SCSIO 12603]|uniref:alpha/beta fold hydrolase n=1 Tax=Kordiimonas sp. SCSIO 12603 TaxID=2829596 RepID=UPI0021081F93|nr:alpha/beta hydrolase [Kordiimonas sp. SCSIO 12603]UTW57072.1 alpha/beta hydrolase [Kordiimonas sp. SCSIO 12603]